MADIAGAASKFREAVGSGWAVGAGYAGGGTEEA